MALDPLTAIVDLANGVGGKLIDRLFPDKVEQAKERAAAELAMLQVTNDADIKLLQASLSAIITEASSTDPWTSRARPSFMYVIYVMLLFGLPMGLLSAFRPDIAAQVATGFGAWLKAIPDSLYALFGAGYLGYTGMRGVEKIKGAS